MGTGALGTVLARALHGAGYPLAGLYNRHEEKAEQLASQLGAAHYGPFPTATDAPGDILFITVPDRHIEEVVHGLARRGPDLRGSCIAHCSGTLSAKVLGPLSEEGAKVASFHPLQTFTARSTPRDFVDIYFDTEGDQAAIKIINDISKALGGNILKVSTHAKPYLHAAAVMVSNHMVALLEAGGQIAESGGLDKTAALRALKPLVQTTVDNITSGGDLREALSGPVARGDETTVAEHLQLLEQKPELHRLYKMLGRLLLALDKEPGAAGDEHRKRIDELLTGE